MRRPLDVAGRSGSAVELKLGTSPSSAMATWSHRTNQQLSRDPETAITRQAATANGDCPLGDDGLSCPSFPFDFVAGFGP